MQLIKTLSLWNFVLLVRVVLRHCDIICSDAFVLIGSTQCTVSQEISQL